jgi:formate-nitrite transporter family protein
VPAKRPTLLAVAVGAPDHVRGSVDAPVTLVEYADFECPFCGRWFPDLQRVLQDLGPRVRFVFRHFPISEQHPHAESAAEAAEAAGAQGKFWEMHDLLFENQRHLAPEDLLRYAGALGLDLARFTSELEQGTHQAKIREDFLSGVRSGVNGTPTFFINGVRHNGGYDAASLLEGIRAES